MTYHVFQGVRDTVEVRLDGVQEWCGIGRFLLEVRRVVEVFDVLLEVLRINE